MYLQSDSDNSNTDYIDNLYKKATSIVLHTTYVNISSPSTIRIILICYYIIANNSNYIANKSN